MVNYVDLDDLHRRLLRPSEDISVELLKKDPNHWIRNHTKDIEAIASVYSKQLPILRDDAIQSILFPRTFILTAAAVQTSATYPKELEELLESQAQGDVISKLANYRWLKDQLRYFLNDEDSFVVVPPQHPPPQGTRRSEPLREMTDQVIQYDAAHLAALVLQCLSGCGPNKKLLLKKADKEVDQNLLDLLQGLLDHPALVLVHPQILRALSHLAKETSSFPRCLVHQQVDIPSERMKFFGSSADVYRGLLDSQPVAVKVVRRHVGSPDTSIEPVLRGYTREAILWSQLHHPNVLPFYGIYLWRCDKSNEVCIPPWVCLLSPWMAKGNLEQYLRAVPSADKMLLVLDIGRGLNYLHTLPQPFIHGDLKSNNVLITSSGTACLADFGLGRLEPDNSVDWRLSTVVPGGPVLFLAPELLPTAATPHSHFEQPLDTMEPMKNTKTDIYAFACACYEMYNSFKPRFADRKNFYTAIRENHPTPRPPGLDNDHLWDWMSLMWQTDPGLRPSMAEFMNEFDHTPSSASTLNRHKWDLGPISRLRSATFFSPTRYSPYSSAATLTTSSSPGQSSVSTLSVGRDIIYDSPISILPPILPSSSPLPDLAPHRRNLVPEAIHGAEFEKFEQDDIILALMGPTGTGKSTFINCAMGRPVAPVSSSVLSCTKNIKVYGCRHPSDPNRRVFLVDTPGFSDTETADRKTLKKIALWLKETYDVHVVLSGIIHFHWIKEARISGTKRINLEVFTQMCGKDALANVVIVSTGWEELDDESSGESRESQLLGNFLAGTIGQGAQYRRFLKREFHAAWDIIDLFHHQGRVLQIQVEMSPKWGLRWNQTAAYKAYSKVLSFSKKRLFSNPKKGSD